MEQAGLSPSVVVKIREVYFGSEQAQHHTRPLAQGSSATKVSPHRLLAAKNSRD